MHRFFVTADRITDGIVRITGEDARHIGLVLRMKPGDEIRVSDGTDDYYCLLREIGPDQVLAQVGYREHGETELPCRITLYQGLPKGDKMEWILQKSVELGAARIVPVRMSRSVVKLDAAKGAAKQKRWQAIAESAAKQSKRIIVPEVAEPMSFSEAMRDAAGCRRRLFPYENAEGMEESRRLIREIQPGDSIAVLIGPEGGFSPEEADEAEAAGFAPMSLGRRILRTETAPLAILSVLAFSLEP